MPDEVQTQAKKPNTVLVVFAWIFSVFFLLGALGSFFTAPIAGVFYLIAGLIINPPFYFWVKNSFAGWLNKWIGIAVAFVCLFGAGTVLAGSLPEIEPIDSENNTIDQSHNL